MNRPEYLGHHQRRFWHRSGGKAQIAFPKSQRVEAVELLFVQKLLGASWSHAIHSAVFCY